MFSFSQNIASGSLGVDTAAFDMYFLVSFSNNLDNIISTSYHSVVEDIYVAMLNNFCTVDMDDASLEDAGYLFQPFY